MQALKSNTSHHRNVVAKASDPSKPKYIKLSDLSSYIPKQKQPIKTKFATIMNFDGLAPERVNGRLAMMGMACWILNIPETMVTQAQHHFHDICLATVAVIFGSLFVMYKDIRASDEEFGFFTADAEMVYGRWAMIGVVSALFLSI